MPTFADAATLTAISATVTNSRPSATNVTYTLTLSSATAATVRCYEITFDTAADGSGSKPTGMTINATSGSLGGTLMSGLTGWTVTNNNAAGSFTVTDAAGGTQSNSAGRTFSFGGITNGSTSNTGYFVILQSYSAQNCTGAVDTGTTMIMFVDGQALSGTVSYVETLSITGLGSGANCNGATSNVDLSAQVNAVPFGTVTAGGASAIACQQFQFGSNASGGATIHTWLSGPFTNGSHNIAAGGLTAQSGGAPQAFPATGTESLGYTTSAQATTNLNFADDSFGSNLWASFGTAFSATERVFASSLPAGSSFATGSPGVYAGGQFNVGYQFQAGTYTPAGTYTTTAVYAASPTF